MALLLGENLGKTYVTPVLRGVSFQLDPGEVLALTGEIVQYARRHVDKCMFSPMDATRTDADYLVEVCRTAAQAGATPPQWRT